MSENLSLAVRERNNQETLRQIVTTLQGQVDQLSNLGFHQIQLGNYKKAVLYYEEALPISTSIVYDTATENIKNNLKVAQIQSDSTQR